MSKKNNTQRFDDSRNLKLVDYILRVLLRLPKISPNQYGDFYARGLGAYVCGESYDSKNVATGEGKEFLQGKRTGTTGQLVAILHRLRKRLDEKYAIPRGRGNPLHREDVPPPTEAQLLEALQISSRLTQDELKQLNLPSYCQHPLLQQTFIRLATTRPTLSGQKLPEVYRHVYQIALAGDQKPADTQQPTNLEEIESYIRNKVGDAGNSQKVQNAINRLLLQAGTGQARFLSELDDQGHYIRNYLSPLFLDRFIDTVITNNQLTARFPIYLKKITLEPVGPFPLPAPGRDPSKSCLSAMLLELQSPRSDAWAPMDERFSQLSTRSVVRVTGHFYIRMTTTSKDYQHFDDEVYKRMRSQVGTQVHQHFRVSTTGIGGTNSLVTKVINGALLRDIGSLRQDYFPIAHDVFIKQINVNQRVISPVSSHSFVHLCANETIAEAMQHSCRKKGICQYEDFSDHDPRGEGNYSDFDTLLSAANAALLGRLQAISNAGIDPDTYIAGLKVRVEQQYLLNEAQAYLTGYPFSSFALESWLQTCLLDEADRQQHVDSYVLYNARLTIAETFLTEGAYRKAYPHLQWLHQALEQDSKEGIDWLEVMPSANHKS